MKFAIPMLLVACLCLSRLQAETIYVSPQGNDQWSGTLDQPNAAATDGPLATLQGARDAIRKRKAGGAGQEPYQVVVAAGTYAIREPLVFTPEDSGTAEHPVVYQAAPGTRPVFSGGQVVTGFALADGGNWSVAIPAVAEGKWYFEQLWVNGRRAIRARSPNKFYNYVAGSVDYGVDPATGQPTALGGRAFQAQAADVQPLTSLTPEQLRDVNVLAYQSWEATRLRIAKLDAATSSLFFTGGAPWAFNQWGPSQRYHIENYRQALDEPGEWFLDRDGTLLYRPLPGEDLRKAEIVAPMLDHFVEFVGAPEQDQWVEHLTLRDLTFRHGQYLLPESGHGDGQAAATIPAAIMADGTRNVGIERCEIGQIGIYGVWFRRGCHDCRVVQSYLHDLGAGGVRIGETTIQPDERNRTHHIQLDNSIIRSVGRIFPGAIGVWIGQSGHNQVTHNDISDTFYTGISVGWTWGYGESLAHHNTIDFNHIHHLGRGVLSDMGAVYTLGISPGTTVSHNLVHDVYSYDRYGRGGWGLYNDEGSSQIVLEGNLVYNVKTGTYHQHYGRENIVRNNVLAYSMDGQIQRSRVEEHLSFTFENNIVLWKDGPVVTAGSLNDERVAMRNNVYWNVSGEPIDFQGQTLQQRQANGIDVGSVIADPLFVDAAQYDFHLKPESPAIALGFKPFDYSQAGLYGPPGWVKFARSFKYPDMEFAPAPPPPPPLRIENDFELTPVGAVPAKTQVNGENKGDSIAVTDTQAAAGSRCLLFTDAPGLEAAFNPHLVINPDYRDGVVRCEFDLRIEEGAVLFHEWRDWAASPYIVGPSLWIRNGSVEVNGQAIANVPKGTWVHLLIEASVGNASTGQWTLTLTVPGQEPQRFAELAFGSPDFKKMTWAGFMSFANEKTVFYIDNLQLRMDAP